MNQLETKCDFQNSEKCACCSCSRTDDSENLTITRYFSREYFDKLCRYGLFITDADSFEDKDDCNMSEKIWSPVEINIDGFVQDADKKIGCDDHPYGNLRFVFPEQKIVPQECPPDIATAPFESGTENAFVEEDLMQSEETDPFADKKKAKFPLYEILGILVNETLHFREKFGGTKYGKLDNEVLRNLARMIPRNYDNIEERRRLLRRMYLRLCEERARATLVSCWALDENEEGCMDMWNKYARDGVRISTTVGKFLEFVKKNNEMRKRNSMSEMMRIFELKEAELENEAQNRDEFLGDESKARPDGWSCSLAELKVLAHGKVVYADMDEHEESGCPMQNLFRKKTNYKFEKEYRFVLGGADIEREAVVGIRKANHPLWLKSYSGFLTEIRISPLLGEKERKDIEKKCGEAFAGVPVK